MTEEKKMDFIDSYTKYKDILIPGFFTVVAFGIGIFIGKIPEDQFIAATFIIIIAGISGGLVYHMLKSNDLEEHLKSCGKCADILNSSINAVIEIQNVALKKFGGSVISYEDLKTIEKEVENDGQIWILTSSLALEDDDFDEIIIENFKKGIQYVYLLPKEDDDLEDIMRHLAHDWKERCGLSEDEAKRQIRCIMVPSHYAYMTVVVYDAQNSDIRRSKKPTVVVKFPTNKYYDRDAYSLVYRVKEQPEEAWRVFVRSLKKFINGNIECKATEELDIFNQGDIND